MEHEPDDTLKRRFAAVLDNAPPTTMKRARSAKLTLAANLGRIIDPEFTVLKFVALSRSLPWIARNFDCRGLIILRSPLGLVASAKEMHDRHPGWSAELVETSYPRTFLELVPELKRFKQVNHIQQMALNYCIDLFFSVASQEAKAR